MIYLNALDLKESTAKVTMSFHKSNLIWLDLEMTGLEPATDKILEIATVVTDSDLNILAEGPVIAIHQSQDATLTLLIKIIQNTNLCLQ